jgi:hypothetical protein
VGIYSRFLLLLSFMHRTYRAYDSKILWAQSLSASIFYMSKISSTKNFKNIMLGSILMLYSVHLQNHWEKELISVVLWGERATAFDGEAVLQSAQKEAVNVILFVHWLNRLMVSVSTRQKNHVLNHTLLAQQTLFLCLQVVEDWVVVPLAVGASMKTCLILIRCVHNISIELWFCLC